MIYGAYGYTGKLTAALAAERGSQPILAGRNKAKVNLLAQKHGFPARVFDLNDPAELRAGLTDVDAVVHMAGPFSSTSAPMVAACLATGTHYLDVTGEVDVFEAVLAQDKAAKDAGVVLLPGVGFDVVPTDCLASKLAAALPDAERLVLAFRGLGASSAGTTKTMVEGLGKPVTARIEGELRPLPRDQGTRKIPFPSGERSATAIPWGDISTAYHSTGIPNITVYTRMAGIDQKRIEGLTKMAGLLRRAPVQWALKKAVGAIVKGPNEEQRATGSSEVWGEAVAPDGKRVRGALTTPEAYTLTADAAHRSVERVLAGDVAPGATTPSKAFGAEFIDSLDGVEVLAIESSG